MPNLIQQEFLPENVKTELIDSQNGKSHFKLIQNFEKINVSVFDESEKIITQNSNSANIFFSEAIKNGFTVASLTGGTSRSFRNFGSTLGTISSSALYEHIRGYVYRDFGLSAHQVWNNYLLTTAGISSLIVSQSISSSPPGVLGSSEAGAALTSVRVLLMNRNFYGDRVKPGTFRMNVRPQQIELAGKIGLNFDNDTKTNSSSGQWAAITGMQGLTGSLLDRGVSAGSFSDIVSFSQKQLTGFTIAMRVKFVNNGPKYQTLFHRRVGNPSLSALGYTLSSGAGINNQIVLQRYSDLKSLSANPVCGVPTGMWIRNPIAGTFNRPTYSGLSISAITGGTSAVWKFTNDGGGQLYWSISAALSTSTTYGKISPWLAPIYNSEFIAGIGTNNGLTGWVNENGNQLEATVTDGIGHGSSANSKTLFSLCAITHYLVLSGSPGATACKRISSTTTKNSYSHNTPAYSIENGSDRVIIKYRATVSGDITNSPTLSSFLIATSNSAGKDLISSVSAVTISSYINSWISTSSISSISLTCELKNGIDRKFDHNGIDLWFKVVHLSSVKSWFGIDDIQCEYVPATLYGIGNRLATTASITSYIDSSWTAQTGATNSPWDFYIHQNHSWIKTPNLPIIFSIYTDNIIPS